MNQKSCLDKSTRVIASFIGSWWGIYVHAAWFLIWFIFGFPLEKLTLLVSLEAIFIGIFLLMAANQAEAEREKREAREQARELNNVKEDLQLDQKEVQAIREVRQMIKTLTTEFEKIKKHRS
jgi:uncharacterized membrane protein